MKLGVKEQIIENAISLFSENGYEGTTLNQIASSVDIKKASLYYHYANKDEIYRSCVNACFNYFSCFIKAAHEDTQYSIENLH
ncbi:TetR/AcrR family transcriptional regulator [Staphylococcus saprophyticus]|nr:TetR/AcrR family transcriptional regulator [Staphylococcus saprophyticus]